MFKMIIAVAYTKKQGGAAKGFLEFLNIREKNEDVHIITADWEYSRFYFFKARINALLSWVLCRVLLKNPVKSSYNIFPVIDISKFDNATIYLGWVGNGMVNFENNPLTKYFVRFSDEWWLSDIQHYNLNDKIIFPKIQKRKMEFLNCENVTIIFPSNWLKNNFRQALGNKTLKCKTEVSRNVASANFFIKPKVNIRRLIFVAANLSDVNKGFDYLINNVDYFKHHFNEIIVVGSTTTHKKVAGVTFRGRLSANELMELFEGGGVYIHLAKRDNSPNSLIEACSAGLIPIVLGGSGSQEYVEDIHFAAPLILDPNRNLYKQLDIIFTQLQATSRTDLEELVVHIQDNIKKICRYDDHPNH